MNGRVRRAHGLASGGAAHNEDRLGKGPLHKPSGRLLRKSHGLIFYPLQRINPSGRRIAMFRVKRLACDAISIAVSGTTFALSVEAAQSLNGGPATGGSWWIRRA